MADPNPDAPLWHLVKVQLHGGTTLSERVKRLRWRRKRAKVEVPKSTT